MIKPYLIQRGKFEKREFKVGIDSIVRFDYMGSSEFEWGALPNSLKRVRDNIDDYVLVQYSFKEQPSVFCFCKKEQQDFIGETLEDLSKNKYRLKEYCDLDGWVNPKENSYNTNDFWWDIDNDWFFWKFTPSFDLDFIKKIKKQ